MLARGATAFAVFVGLLVAIPVVVPASAETVADAWTIDTVAGVGEFGYSGDGGQATSAQLSLPLGVAKDTADNLYVADTFNQVIRKVSPSGVITTIAGTGRAGYNGDGIPAAEAMLNYPVGIDTDAAGNLYIADSSNHRIRRIDPSGMVTTVAGTGAYGYGGDGGPATEAQIAQSQSVSVDSAGNLYIADSANNAVRKVDPAGSITTVAGTGVAGYSGDGGPAAAAMLFYPADVTVDLTGNLYIADMFNHRIRKVDPAGSITTAAGTGEAGYSGDGGPATDAQLNTPTGVEAQASGNVFISDYYNSAIRRVDAAGVIATVAGMGSPGYSGDGAYGPFALLNQPVGLELDDAGNLYIAEAANNVVRRLATSYVWIGSAPEPAKVGGTFTYDLSVSGLPGPATRVTLSASLAAEVALVGLTTSQGRCTRTAATVTCLLGTVEPGETANVQVTVTAQGAGVVPITATVTAIPGQRIVTAYTRVSAAECGREVTRSTRLGADIGPCAGDGVIIGQESISFDLGGHRIYGFAGPGTGNDAGIRLPFRGGVTVRNGTVSDFDAGVVINGGSGNTVTDMTIRDNVGPDDAFNADLGDGIVLFDSAANLIVDNVLTHNGVFDGIGVLGELADDNVIEGNTVLDTVGPIDAGAAGQGIIVNGAGLQEDPTGPALLISGTLVEGNVVRGSGSSGISNVNNLGARILDNVVVGNGLTNFPGNGIGLQLGPLVEGIATQALIQGNEVHGNGFDGIQIQQGATENQILHNDAADNNALGVSWSRGIDLHDLNPRCDANVWNGNIWGHGYYDPACVTAGGSGPAPPSTVAAIASDAARQERLPPTRHAPSR